MATLYTQLAPVYDAMYRTFMDYDREFAYYEPILRAHGARTLLEVGSGTGQLAARFAAADYDYVGLDFSADMLALARRRLPAVRFEQGDMRDLKRDAPVDAILVAGRTISYLVSNADVHAALGGFRQNLRPGGLLCFDFIDASAFVPAMHDNPHVTHVASDAGVDYRRDSTWTLQPELGWVFRWDSRYYRLGTGEGPGEPELLGADSELARSFTRDEVEVFLRLAGFEAITVELRGSYFFPTYVVQARRRAE